MTKQDGNRVFYAYALAVFSFGAFIAVIVFTAIGREARGIEFISRDEEELGGGPSMERARRHSA
jgi:hypothetical protein